MMMQLVVKNASPVPFGKLASVLNAMTYFKSFASGKFNSEALAFFLTVSSLFLFLSVKTLESKRWR